MRAQALLGLILWVLSSSSGSQRLRLPYYDWGACPFEGCTYRAWKVVRPTIVWKERDYQSPAEYRLDPGEWVEGVTGVVITYQPGLSEVLAPVSLGYGPSVSVVPGDMLLTLHPLGEGHSLFWFKGRTYSDEIDQIASDEPEPDAPPWRHKIRFISSPLSAWWVKVKNEKGQVGWTDQTRNFENMDRHAGESPLG
jgi:hypothetical protein